MLNKVTFFGVVSLRELGSARWQTWDMELRVQLPFVPVAGMGLGPGAPVQVLNVNYTGALWSGGEYVGSCFECECVFLAGGSQARLGHLTNQEVMDAIRSGLEIRNGSVIPAARENVFKADWVFTER